MTRPLLAFGCALAAATGLVACGTVSPADEVGVPGGSASPGTIDAATSDAILLQAFNDHARQLQVLGTGTVIRLLADDDDGSRHQRFVLRLASGQTLLVVHNIDLAPRVRGLRVRDTVEFYGEYEWNDEGGTIHWTHLDPNGEHVAGWVRLHGRTFQ